MNKQHSVKHLDRCGLAPDNYFAYSIICKGGDDGYGKRLRLILKAHYYVGEKTWCFWTMKFIMTLPIILLPCILTLRKEYGICDRRKENGHWCIVLTLQLEGSNYSEASMCILKDHIFKRTRAYNIVLMFYYLSITLELYFEKQLLDTAHNHPSPHSSCSQQLVRK